MIKYKIGGSDWLTFPLIIVNFKHFFIQPAPGYYAHTNDDAPSRNCLLALIACVLVHLLSCLLSFPSFFSAQEVHEEGKLPNVLDSLKNILQTPIKPFIPADSSDLTEGHVPPPCPHPDDLPSQLTKVIGKGTES